MSSDKSKKGPKDLSSLTEEDRKLLAEKFGLDLSGTSDLTELQKQLNKTRAKIEEIERKAKRKLGLDDDQDE